MDKKDKALKLYRELVQSFDTWLTLVKANDLEEAANVTLKAKELRKQIAEIEKQLNSKIITL